MEVHMNRFDETIKNMQDIVSDIKEVADRKLTNATQEEAVKIATISEKTIDTINEASVKLKNVVEQINNEEELNKFLDRVDEKCKQAADFAYKKFDEIKPGEDAEYVKIKDDNYKSTMEKFVENQNVQGAIKMATNIKDSVVDFINKPETQKTIKDVKLTALNVADKGLDKMIDFLEKVKTKTENKDD